MTNGPTTIDDDSSAAELDDENPAAADTAGDRDTSRDAGTMPSTYRLDTWATKEVRLDAGRLRSEIYRTHPSGSRSSDLL
jgi:hypothetical protein